MRSENGSLGVTFLIAIVATLCCTIATVFAENIDPANDDSQYAYAENVGWLNAELDTDGDGTPDEGVTVADFELTGWMWAENVGWISLSCKNTGTCGVVDYGVENDGNGRLSGFAWAENVGWINFSCDTLDTCATTDYGVSIDASTGDFSGQAWGENIGWITFADTSPVAYKVTTGWNCHPQPPAPAGTPELTVAKFDTAAVLSWTTVVDATGYDVVRGDVGCLAASGDFSSCTESCLANNHTETAFQDDHTVNSGKADWYLVRGVNCGGAGTHDTPIPPQHGSRDPGIESSPDGCE